MLSAVTSNVNISNGQNMEINLSELDTLSPAMRNYILGELSDIRRKRKRKRKNPLEKI